MNDFGVPMGDAEMNMQPIKPHEKMMAESGLENNFWEALVAGGISLIGGMQSRSAAKSARNDEEAFLKKRYEEYDLPGWEMQKERLEAGRDEQVRAIDLQIQNEKRLAKFKDTNALRNYQQDLKIRQYGIEQQERLFRKSESLYASALGLNRESEIEAKKRTQMQFDETVQKYAFQNEDAIIENIIAKGQLDAEGQAGRSAAKRSQSKMADLGRQQEVMTASLVSAGINTRMTLNDITRQRKIADRQAYAQRMLKPEAPPEALVPLAQLISKRDYPRELEDFDFGPKPIPGAATTQVPGMFGVLANAVGAGFSSYAASTAGSGSFKGDTNNYGGHYTMESNSLGGVDRVWNSS